MMTLIAQLCALCAVCALMQMALEGVGGGESLRMIGGLLMLHLVISKGYALSVQLAQQRGLSGIFEILMK